MVFNPLPRGVVRFWVVDAVVAVEVHPILPAYVPTRAAPHEAAERRRSAKSSTGKGSEARVTLLNARTQCTRRPSGGSGLSSTTHRMQQALDVPRDDPPIFKFRAAVLPLCWGWAYCQRSASPCGCRGVDPRGGFRVRRLLWACPARLLDRR